MKKSIKHVILDLSLITTGVILIMSLSLLYESLLLLLFPFIAFIIFLSIKTGRIIDGETNKLKEDKHGREGNW